MPDKVISPSGSSRLPFVIAALVVGAVGGFFLGFQGGSSKAVKENYDKGYAAAREADNAKLKELGLIRPDMMEEEGRITSLSGQIDSVGSDSLVMTVTIRPASPLDEPTSYKATVKVGAETEITLLKRVSEEEFMAQVEKFQTARMKAEKDGEGQEMIEPPSQYVSEKIKVTDLKPGMEVSVETKDDARNKTEVDATGISVRELERGMEEPTAEEAPAPEVMRAPEEMPGE